MNMPYRNEEEFVRGQKLKLLITLTIFLYLLVTGCAQWFPAEPVVLPACRMLPIYDQYGQIFAYQVDPGQFVGVYMNCDITNKVYPNG